MTTENFTRVFNAARKAQGFKSQAHLDAFYANYDHTKNCAACKARDGHALLNDGWQPTVGQCDEARRLDAVTREESAKPVDFAVGERVRSYDFEHRTDCYAEGYVVGFKVVEGCLRYEIAVAVDVWEDVRVERGERGSRVDGRVFPPVNGTPRLFGGACDGVRAA